MAGRSAITRWTQQYFIQDFGAVVDGTTDDSTAVQAAIDAAITAGGGTVVFPIGTCAIATTLRVGAPSGTTTTYISLEGMGDGVTVIRWNGSTSGTAVKLVRNKHFTIRNLAIRNNVAKGTTIGLQQTGYGGVGTETLAGYFEHVTIVGFAVGLQAGETLASGGAVAAAASDSEYHSITLSGNDTGFKIVEGNSKNHFIFNLQITENAVCGLDITGGSAWVTGGASYDNAIDIRSAALVTTIRDFRAELSAGSIFLDILSGGLFTVQGCELSDSIDASTIAVRASGTVMSINVIDCLFFCRILVNVSPWMLSVSNSFLWGATTYPFFFGSSAGTIWRARVSNVINHEGDPAVSPTFTLYNNYEGTVTPFVQVDLPVGSLVDTGRLLTLT